MRRTPVAAVLLAASALALVGCGPAQAPEADASATTATIASDPEIAALLPEDIAAAGVLVVGSDTSYAPAEFLDEDGTTPVGYDVDLINAIGAVLGLEVDVQTAPFDAIIPAVGTKYDVGMSSFTITPERMEQVTMISYYSAGEAYAVQATNPAGVNPDDLCGLTVSVQTATVEDDEIEAYSQQCVADGKAAVDILRYDAQSDVTTNLVGGKVDVMYADSPIVAYSIEQTGDQLEQLGEIFATAPQGIVVSPEDDELAAAIAAALQKLIDDGTYQDILSVWGNQDGAVATAEVNPAVD